MEAINFLPVVTQAASKRKFSEWTIHVCAKFHCPSSNVTLFDEPPPPPPPQQA